MAKVSSYYNRVKYYKKIYLEANFVKNESLCYDENSADYLNHIPIELKLSIGEDIHQAMISEDVLPTLSIEGIKYFFTLIDKLIDEKNTLKIKFADGDDRWYSAFNYMATEADFEIIFKNLYDDEREVAVVKITVWLPQGGYTEGYQFMTTLKECIEFFDDLKSQLSHLISSLT